MLDHLTLARHWKQVADAKDAEVYVCRSLIESTTGKHVFFHLSERYYPGIEVEWTHRMRLTEEQAREIVSTGIAQDWAGWFNKPSEKKAI